MAEARLTQLKVLRRTPEQLIIGIRPFQSRDLFFRVIAGIVVGALGVIWWDRSWAFGGLCLGIAIYLGFPSYLGETISFDKPKDRVRRVRHRYWLWNPVLAQHPISEIAQLQTDREATNRYAEGEYSYHCRISLILKDGESVVLGDYTSRSLMAMPDQRPREMARKLVGWIRDFLDLPQPSR